VIWKHNADGGWHFVSLPTDISADIRVHLKEFEEGWGRLKVTAQLDDITWPTAIWFDTKRNTYLLPLKVSIRTKRALSIGDEVTIKLSI
jgi:hypothetical protein